MNLPSWRRSAISEPVSAYVFFPSWVSATDCVLPEIERSGNRNLGHPYEGNRRPRLGETAATSSAITTARGVL